MLMLTIGWSLSACAKGGNPSNNQPPQSGGNDKPQEIVLLDFDNVIDVGASLGRTFLNEFEYGDNLDLFEQDIVGAKALFLDASEMIAQVKNFNNITYEWVLAGEKIVVPDDRVLPEQVNKFSIYYSKDATTGYSKVDIRLVFSYPTLDVVNNYDFYNFVIETNQISKTVHLTMSVEKATASSSNNSTARYEVLEINSDLNDLSNFNSYRLFGYERSRVLTSYAAKDIYNSIQNFTKSEFDGVKKDHMDAEEGDVCLRNDDSSEFALIVDSVSNLGQCVKRLQMSKALKTISGFSFAMISCFEE